MPTVYAPDGDDTLVNTTTPDAQAASSVIWLSDGLHYVVVWQSSEGGNGNDVRARIFAADGTPVAADFLVAGDVAAQFNPQVTARADGGFIVVWVDSDAGATSIQSRSYDAGFTASDPVELVPHSFSPIVTDPHVAASATGANYVVSWTQEVEGNLSVMALFVGAAAPGPFFVGQGSASSVSAVSTGGYDLAWVSGGSIYWNRYDAAGAVTYSENWDAAMGLTVLDPVVADLTGGNAVVAWSVDDGAQSDIYARIYDSVSHTFGSVFLVNATTDDNQYLASVTALPDGGFVISWTDASGADNDIRARRFDASGLPVGDEFLVSSDTDGDQIESALAASPADGHLVVTSTDIGADVAGDIEQRLFSLASPASPGTLSIGDDSHAEGDAGATVFTFTVTRADGSDGAVDATWTITAPGGVGGADSGDFAAGQLLTGTVSFIDGQISQDIIVNVAGDILFEPTETFTITLSAPTGGATIADADGTGTITNDDAPAAPTVDLNGAADGTGFDGAFSENGAGAPIGDGIAVTAPDLPITGATITITDAIGGDQLTLSGTPPATITVFSGSGTSQLVLTGTGSASDWATALSLVRYATASDNPDAFGTDPARTITVQVSDGVNASAAATATIAITASNDDPAVTNFSTASGDSATFTEGDAYVLLDNGNATVADADSADFSGGSLTFGMLGAERPEDMIFVQPGGNISLTGSDVFFGIVQIGTIGTPGVGEMLRVDLNSSATPAAVQELIRAIAYGNSGGDNPTPGAVPTIAYILTDGDGGGTGASVSVNVVATNDPPVVANAIPDQHRSEDTAVSYQVPANSFSDPEGEPLTYDATLANGSPLPGWLSFDANTRTFSGTPPLNFNGTIPLRVTASDGALTAFDDFDLVIDPVNDAPTAAITAPPGVAEGGETLVHTSNSGSPDAAVAGLSGGGYVVTWVSDSRIYAQRYDASGVPQGNEFLGGTITESFQSYPSIAALASGGYVVTWTAYGQDAPFSYGIYSHRYDASGVAQGVETRINATTAGDQQIPSVAGLSGGGYVVTWASFGQDGSSWGVYAQRYNASGVAQGVETRVNTTTADRQEFPTVAALSDGGYVVTWQSLDQDGEFFGVYAQRYDASGVAQGGETLVNTTTANNQQLPSVAGLSGGGYVVTWQSINQDGGGSGIYAQRYDASGAAQGGETLVNTTTANNQQNPSVSALPGGGYIVTWMSANQDGSGFGIYAQRYDASGAAQGGETLVNTTTANSQQYPSVAGLAGGGYVVTWQSADSSSMGIYAQRYGTGFTATEQVAVSLKGTMSVADVDAGAGSVTVTLSVGYGVLHVEAGTSGAEVGLDNDSASVTITGTIAEINALLGAGGTSVVTFTANTDAPPATTTLTLAVNDGGASGSGGPQPGSDSETIHIAGINDAPSVDLNGAGDGTGETLAYTENAAASPIAPMAVVADPDSADFNGGTLTVAFTAGGTADDRLSILFQGTGPGQVSWGGNQIGYEGQLVATFAGGGDGSAPLVITFNATADLEAVQAVLRVVSYANVSDNPATAARSLSYTLTDGDGGTSAAATATVNLTAVNDPPVVDLNGADVGTSAAAFYTENGAAVAIAPSATLADPDGTSYFGGTITVTFTSGGTADDRISFVAGNGISLSGNVIRYNGVDVATYAVGATNGLTPTVINLEAAATAASTEAVLRAIAYSNASDNPGTAQRVLSFVVNDHGAGGTSSAVSATIDVTATADPPSGADKTITFDQDSPYVFGTADFGFTDPDGDQLLAIKISSLPGAGTLLLNGVGVNSGDEIAASEIVAGHLTFAAAGSQGGGGLASFTFQVRDDSGATDLDLSANTVTFNGSTLHYSENGGATALANYATLVNPVPDFANGSLTVTVTNGSADDRLTVLQTGGITLSANVIRYNGVDIATYPPGGTDGITPLVINFVPVAAASAAAVQALLRAIAFSNVSDDPTTEQRQVAFSLDDGHGHIVSPASAAVDVTAVNDAPTSTGLDGDAVTFTEGGSVVALDLGGDATLADIDSADFDGGSLTIATTSGSPGIDGDLILINPNGIVTVSGSDVLVDGITIGSFTGQTFDVPLVFSFNANATPARVQELMHAIVYRITNTFNPSTASRTVTWTLVDGDDDGNDTLAMTNTVNVVAVNDAPFTTNLAGNTVTATESGGQVLLDAASNAILFDDNADFGGGTLTLSVTGNAAPAEDRLDIQQVGNVTVAAGHVSVGGVDIGAYTGGSPGADLVISFNGDATPARVQELLRALSYENVNALDPSTLQRTVTWTLVDGDGTSGGGADTMAISTFVNVTGVNDAPTSTGLAGDTVTFTEGGSVVALDLGGDATLADADSADFAGGSLTVAITSGGGLGEDLILINPNGIVTVSGSDVLVGGITIASFTGQTFDVPLVFSFNANATAARVQELLHAIVYRDANTANPSTATRTVTWTLVDGDGQANSGQDTLALTTQINVTAVNDAPVIDLDGGAPPIDNAAAYTENAVPTLLATALEVGDVDDTNIESASVRITGGLLSGFDYLTVNGGTNGTISGIAFSYSASTGILTLTGSATLADYQAVLRQVGFESTSDAPGTTRTVSWTLNDGTDDSAAAQTIVTVTPVNDAPLGTNHALAFTEDTPHVFTAADFAYTDAENDDLLSVTIATLPGPGLGTIYYDADGAGAVSSPVAITAGQTFTAEDLSEGRLSYVPPADANGNGYATFDYIVRDDGGTDNNGADTDPAANTITIDLAAVNDAPTVTVGALGTATEQVALSLKNTIAIGDVDAASGPITVTLAVGYGILTVTAGGSGAGVAGTGTGTVTLTGTLAQIQALLGADASSTVLYTANTDNPPASATLTVTINDGGNTGSGPNPDVSDSEPIAITPINDAPAGIDHHITANENAPRALTPAVFTFTDAESHGLLSVTIASLPTRGTIYFDADGPSGNAFTPTPIMAGQTFAASDLAAARLTYRAVADEDGLNYATFTYVVRDNGGTSGGGQDTDGSANTITIDVGGFNNAPTVTGLNNDALTYYEDTLAGVAWLDVDRDAVVTDIDSGDFDGGMLLVHIVSHLNAAEDQLVLTTGTNGVTMVGDTVFVDGVSIGTLAGGGVGEDLTFTLNTGAIPERITRVIHNLSYVNVNTVAPDTQLRLVEFRLTDGDGGTMTAFTTIDVVSVDDLATAGADAATTDEATAIVIDVVANDDDIDGPPPSVAAINGTPVTVGTPIALPTGALVTVNADGTLTYDPNHVFDSTPTAGSGAVNTPALDSFSYTLAGGGGTATVAMTITGVDSNDTLLGTSGNDTLAGGLGDDSYFVENAGDSVVESAGQGYDIVYAAVDYVLAAGTSVELLGTVNNLATTALNLTGNELANYVTGNAGANVLDGGGGADLLWGRVGDDSYFADSDDVVVENAGEGYDILYARTDYTLIAGASIELLGTVNNLATTALNLTGNELNNYVTGNAGNNILDGGVGGLDLLRGREGDDSYFMDADDVVIELAGQGYDIVYARTDFTLAAGVSIEKLGTVNNLATTPLNLTGNELNNYVTGNAGANILDGGSGGLDLLWGREGDDSYFVDGDDVVVELAGHGYDIVYARADHTLLAGAAIEKLGTVNNLATTAINLTGNELGNFVTGNAGANRIDGGLGADVLEGRGGADTFAFTTALGGGNVDFIIDFLGAGTDGEDIIALDHNVFTGLAVGALDPDAIAAGAVAQDADDRIIYDAETGNLYFDADGTGSIAAILFAQLVSNTPLSAGDFVVI